MQPRKRTSQPTADTRIATLSIDLWFELVHGRPGMRHVCDGDIALLTAAWKLHGAAILAEYIEKHPCRRPFAWWACEHRKERPIVRGPLGGEDRFRKEHTRFGYLHSVVWQGPLESWGQVQEPQEKYLARHNLLSAAERKWLAERKDEPE